MISTDDIKTIDTLFTVMKKHGCWPSHLPFCQPPMPTNVAAALWLVAQPKISPEVRKVANDILLTALKGEGETLKAEEQAGG